MRKNYFLVVVLTFLFSISLCAPARAAGDDDLTTISMEELMDKKVYTASRKMEKVLDTAAAITVITPEDIRRSGATTIPELLRMVPGVTVQKIDSNSWDVSARGFTGSIYANKLLVMIDGRSVYNPLYGGVYWDVQDVVLEDIERIEVIRGPGGTLWGANAVNGVVNVITKKAKDTQGTLVSGGAGTEERGFGSVRYGGQVKEQDFFYRAYAKYFDRDDGFRPDGAQIDNWDMGRAGFRAEKGMMTLQGDIYHGNIGQRVTLADPFVPLISTLEEQADVKGFNLSSKFEDDDWSMHAYWDRTERESILFGETRDRLSAEYTRLLMATAKQEMVWGVGTRLELENMSESTTITVNEPEHKNDYIVNLFFQDEIKATDKLKFIVGTKLEYNIYTNLEIQPNVRALYHINDKNQVWAAASRAVRTPTRIQNDAAIFGYTPAAGNYKIVGNRDLSSEALASYEVGYRTQATKKVFFDVAGYANHYDELITFNYGDLLDINGTPVRAYPTVNGMKGQVHGLEVSSDIVLTDWWKVKTAYALSKMTLTTDDDITNLAIDQQLENALPYNTAYVRSSFDLPHGFAFDTVVRHTDSYNRGAVPTSTELDLVLGKAIKEWQVSLVGQNLIRDHHKESSVSTMTEVERSGYVKLTREF